jgi:hypothetical protein
MPSRADLKRPAAALRAAERDFDAATGRSSLNAAIRRLMLARAALRAAQAERSMASCVEAVEALFSAPGAQSAPEAPWRDSQKGEYSRS